MSSLSAVLALTLAFAAGVVSAPGGLTDWNRSYLTALYEHDQLRINRNSQARVVAEAVTPDRHEATEAAPE